MGKDVRSVIVSELYCLYQQLESVLISKWEVTRFRHLSWTWRTFPNCCCNPICSQGGKQATWNRHHHPQACDQAQPCGRTIEEYRDESYPISAQRSPEMLEMNSLFAHGDNEVSLP